MIYINDLPAVSKLFMPILFADDTNLFCTSQNVNSIIEEINRELANVYAWVQSNKLSLNIDKTNYMLFSPKCACKPNHYAIFHIWDKPWLETDQYQLIRLVNETRLAEYKETISTTDWSILAQYKSCEVYFTHFFNKMKSIHHKSFPIIKVKKRYRNRIPWLTPGLRESIEQKNKLYRISSKHPTAYNETL